MAQYSEAYIAELREKEKQQLENGHEIERYLERVTKRYAEGDLETKRRLATRALAAVLEKLEELGVKESATEPLYDLHMAIRDAERGGRSPMLEVPKVSHRPGLSTAEMDMRVNAVLAMELLMNREDFNKQSAAKYVAKELKRIGVPVENQSSDTAPWKVVVGWRTQLRKDAKGGHGVPNYRIKAGSAYEILSHDYRYRVQERWLKPAARAKRLILEIAANVALLG